MQRSGTTVISLNRIVAVLLAAALVLGFGIYGSYRVQANHALREAKNVALTMKLLAVYDVSGGSTMLDALRSSGMTEAAEAEVLELSDASGDIVLTAWDEENGAPAAFTYAYKQCIVRYEAEGGRNASWSVDYRLPMIHYG